ncbi:MAG TPA: hypothetical protein VM487_11725 [Phycisphaerae bacterium]|nr:hypothetical protein [Phycisphaerae bacterium]
MPGTLVPGQMFDHELNEKKGWPSPYAVDYSAAYAAGVTGALAGSVVSLDLNGAFVRGLPTAGGMAIFLLQNQSDFDVSSDVGNISGGVGSGLVACGAYELQTTEFVAAVYAPNDRLTVENSAVSADYGKLKAGTEYVDDIVGVVSAGQTDSEHSASIKFLAFWPVWLPQIPQ